MDVEIRHIPIFSKTFNVRRRDRRYISSVPFTVQRFLRFGPFVTRGVSLDVSLRGMSGLICGAPRVGETVEIELVLSGVPLEVLATVRHSSDARSGFEFYPLSPVAQQGIQDWVLELEKQEHALSPVPFLFAGRPGAS